MTEDLLEAAITITDYTCKCGNAWTHSNHIYKTKLGYRHNITASHIPTVVRFYHKASTYECFRCAPLSLATAWNTQPYNPTEGTALHAARTKTKAKARPAVPETLSDASLSDLLDDLTSSKK